MLRKFLQRELRAMRTWHWSRWAYEIMATASVVLFGAFVLMIL